MLSEGRKKSFKQLSGNNLQRLRQKKKAWRKLDITEKYVENYVRELIIGMSKDDRAIIGAINKVMLHDERWDNESRVILSKVRGKTEKVYKKI